MLMIAFSIFKLLIYAGLILFVCYYFVYKVILKLLERRRIHTNGICTEATVVDSKAMRDSDGVIRYYPILQYNTADGKPITVQSKKERYQKYEVGKKLTVYYLADEPQLFFIKGIFPYIRLTSIIVGVLSSLLLLIEIYRTIKKF